MARGMRANHYGAITDKERERMVKLHDEGFSYAAIGKIFGLSHSTVGDNVKRERMKLKAKESNEGR